MDRLIRTYDIDVGCAAAADLMDVFAERYGTGAARRYPGVDAHLRSCCPCRDDLEGLLALINKEAA